MANWARVARTPATILCVLGLLLIAAMARPLLSYPRRVKALAAPDGTRVTLEITHEVSCFECLTLGLASGSYDGYGLTVRLARPDGTRHVVEALSDYLRSETEARPELVDLTDDGRLVLSAPGGRATVDLATGEVLEDQ
ncbi:MAG TPA: hypothetical protein VNE39_01880 [Planctomycetota bacterium]|nr:hypothetical protein [Planctomycetota bacterium]